MKRFVLALLLVACTKKTDDTAARTAAIDAYYTSTIKPTEATIETEPTRVAGRVLPITQLPPAHGELFGKWGVDPDVYRALDPTIRIDRLDGADTIVASYHDTQVFVGGGQMGTAPSGAWVIVFDVKTKKPTGRMLVELKGVPDVATKEQLADEKDRLGATIAARLKALPR